MSALHEAFQAYAIETRKGPHVTIQAGVWHRGRYWTTTSRSSLKAAELRRRGRASVTFGCNDGTTRIISGRTTVLDPRGPLSAFADPTGALCAGPAVVRLAIEQAKQLVGYLESAHNVPRDWFPDQRLLLSTRPDHELVIARDGAVTARGAWKRDGIDFAVSKQSPALALEELTSDEADQIGTEGPLHIGVLTSEGPVALPAAWTVDQRVSVNRFALERLAPALPGPVCLVSDDSTSRRPDEKYGVMLRGVGAVNGVEGDDVLLSVATQRVTTWNGFEADTRTVA